jgi:hypothetical protein
MKDSKRSDLSEIQLVKLMAIYEIYGFFDCALELIDAAEEQLSGLIPILDIKNSLIENHNYREGASRMREKGSLLLKKSLRKLLR